MSGRRPTRRLSVNDTLRRNKAALDFMADATGKPRLDITIAPKRQYNRGSNPDDLESGVVNAVSELLSYHPLVLFAVRQNSGAAHVQDVKGRYYPIWFYKFVRRRAAMRITDFWGLLVNGRPFALEAKRRGWNGPHDLRDHEQLAFIECVKAAGGIGAFVRSSQEAEEALALAR